GAAPRIATWILAAYWAGLMIGRLIGARLLATIRKERLVFASGIGSAIGTAILIGSPSLITMAIGATIIGLSFAAIYPTTLAIAARVGIEAEDVLDGDDGDVCDGRERRADQSPFDRAVAVDAEIRLRVLSLHGRRVLEPAARRVVVVRARVDDRHRIVHVWQVRAVHLRKCELQNLHARYS